MILNRKPDFIVKGYLERYFLIPRNDKFNIYLHLFLSADHPNYHNHPWNFTTQILQGSYYEKVYGTSGYTHIKAGILHNRTKDHFHYVAKIVGDVWTLVTTGEYEQEWGFMNEKSEFEIYSDFLTRMKLPQGEYT